MQGRGSVIRGIDIKLSIPKTETCDTLFFSRAGKHSRVSGHPSMRKEIGLPGTVRSTLGSVEVMRVRPWGSGNLQSSAVSPRSLGRAGSEDSCWGSGGYVWILRGGFGQLTLQCLFMAQLGHRTWL